MKEKSPVMSLMLTAPSLMGDVKVKDDVADSAGGSIADPGSAGGYAYEELQTAMKCLCMVYDVTFRRLIEVVEQSGEDTCECVHAVIGDSLYNTRRIAELSNSEHDGPGLQEMNNFVEFLFGIYGPGCASNMLCSALLFKTLYELLIQKGVVSAYRGFTNEVKHVPSLSVDGMA